MTKHRGPRYLGAALVLLFGSLATGPAGAQEAPTAPPEDSEPHSDLKRGKVLRAFRIVGQPPVVDGRLDDEIWGVAETIDDFVQVDPDNMVPPSERTAVQVAYDDRFLYVAVRAYDREPSQVAGGLGRRDLIPPSDRIMLSFDPRHDHLTAYVYDINPSGVQADRTFFDDTQQNLDYSGVWEVETQLTDEGWMAEFQIPFSQMQFDVPSGDEVVWGFTVRRDVYRRGEIDRWVGLPRGEVGFVSLFGHLVFGDRLSPPRRMELQPFGFARREDSAVATAGQSFSGGVDLRFGLGTWGTLSGTINPDFGQVELDPAVLNLTVFESFFPEKRSFFLEESGTFRLPYGEFPVFHSRRIGQRPGRLPLLPSDRLVERPDQTTILGAAKLSGKASRWTYGALTALTAAEYATVDAIQTDASGTETSTRTRRRIEPLSSYNVLRVQRDVLGGTSNVGAIATAVVRDRDSDAFTGGVDYNVRWGRNLFAWDGHWVATRAPFDDGQRTGLGGVTNFRYSGKYFGVESTLEHFSPSFRNTDLGFRQGRVDKTGLGGILFLRQPDPRGIFQSIQVGLGARGSRNRDRLTLGRSVGASANLQFRNFWGFQLYAERRLRAMDDLDTRGGPPIVTPAETSLDISAGTDWRKPWRVSLRLNGTRDEEGGWSSRIGPELGLQPSARLQTSVSVNYGVGEDAAQWITNQDPNGSGETEYVYGMLRQHVVDVTARATLAFHRDLTLEVFGQPFVAVGDYGDIRRLARPRSFEFEPTTIAFDPDFNRKSLRANVILRWEYLRGSTLFLVWNVSTLDEARPGVFAPVHDLGDAIDADGTHVFMLKMTYWLGR